MKTESRGETYVISLKELDRIALNMERNIERLKARIRERESNERSKQLLTARQVSELIQCHPYYVYHLVKRGLPCLKLSQRKLRFQKGAVESWLKKRQEIKK